MILGIAGKACSGKNAAAFLLEQRGFFSIDVDKLGHKALEQQKEVVARQFGEHVLNDEGAVDRKALGSLVFKDRSEMRKLEAITHPVIFSMVEKTIRSSQSGNIIINAAILGPSGMDKLCERVLWIESPLFLRIKRAITRDGNRISAIIARIRSQKDLTVQHFSADVDIYMVRNRGKLIDLEKQINLFLSHPENFKRV
jgi:dephospho-CoA kinase